MQPETENTSGALTTAGSDTRTPESEVPATPAEFHETIGVDDSTPAVVLSEVPESVQADSKKDKRQLVIAAGIFAIAAIAAGAYYWYMYMQSPALVIGGVEYPAVIAVINGEKVPVAEFEQSYKQAAVIATQQGYDPATDPAVHKEVETQALTILVNTILALQAATAAGHTASDEAINEAAAELEAQFGSKEQLATALAGVGLDEAGMRRDLAEQIIVDAFIAASPEWQEISVTDEEVKAYYDLAAEQVADIPPFEEVTEQIKAQLTSEKQQAATSAILDRLRTEASIEMKI